jgi:hypothetical protein
LKQTRSKKGWTGTWRTDKASDPHRRMKVPWMSEWAERRRERRRKADVLRVANVKGRKMRIWRTVENLWGVKRRRRGEEEKTSLAAWEMAVEMAFAKFHTFHTLLIVRDVVQDLYIHVIYYILK